MPRRIYHFSGRVQGVGFRYTTERIAIRHPVSGYVRNLPDGGVELVIEGDDAEIDAVFNTLRQRMGEYISEVQVQRGDATDEFSGFSVRP